MRTVVVQVEDCEIALLVGYRPASGEATDTLLARIAAEPRAHQLEAAKVAMAREALAPLVVTLDGKPLVATSLRAKIGVDPGGTRPMVVVLVTYSIRAGGSLAVTSHEARTTRISWSDRSSHRVDLDQAPSQGKWFTGVASFLLSLTGLPGASACVTSPNSSDSSPPSR